MRLTKSGHTLIESMVRQLLEHEASLINALDAPERTALAAALAKLEQTLTATTP